MGALLYPIALDLRGRRCVVVGGGPVGERKARALAEAGADVVVVAPEITPGLAERLAANELAHVAEPFSAEHLDCALLAITATDDAQVNDTVATAAHARGVLVNRADAPGDNTSNDGDFVTMATVRRGELLLALTTGGAGPALTARLRRELEARFGDEWGGYVALLREMRDLVKQSNRNETERAAALRRLANADGVREKLASGDADEARKEARACLSG